MHETAYISLRIAAGCVICKQENRPLCFIHDVEILDQMSDY